MAKERVTTIYREIEAAVQAAQRDLGRGVLPRDVQARLPFLRAEGSLRRDMMALVEQGRLVRIGGQGARKGYRLPTRIEKLSWAINGGYWPWGSEMVWAA